MVQTTFLLEWDAHEYEHKMRSSDWFWAVGIITLGVALTSIILGNIIFAILILISVFSLSLFINRPPETTHVVIDESGITKNRVQYQYSTLVSFWIDKEHSHPKILLRSQKLLMPLIVIPLGDDVDVERLTRILTRYLKQEYHSLPFVEKCLEYLGF